MGGIDGMKGIKIKSKMEESLATYQGSTTFVKQRKTLSNKEEYTTDRSTIRTNANGLILAHGIDQRTRIRLRHQLASKPHMNLSLSSDIELIFYQKSRRNAWIYRKSCVKLLSMLDFHSTQWPQRVKVKINADSETIANLLWKMCYKDWLENTEGYKSFDEYAEKSQNLKNLLDIADSLDKEDPGSVLRCPRCQSNKVDDKRAQTRGADEAETIFAHCQNCHHRFKN